MRPGHGEIWIYKKRVIGQNVLMKTGFNPCISRDEAGLIFLQK